MSVLSYRRLVRQPAVLEILEDEIDDENIIGADMVEDDDDDLVGSGERPRVTPPPLPPSPDPTDVLFVALDGIDYVDTVRQAANLCANALRKAFGARAVIVQQHHLARRELRPFAVQGCLRHELLESSVVGVPVVAWGRCVAVIEVIDADERWRPLVPAAATHVARRFAEHLVERARTSRRREVA